MGNEGGQLLHFQPALIDEPFPATFLGAHFVGEFVRRRRLGPESNLPRNVGGLFRR